VALINHRTREIHFKLVYYGCGLCGKTTNLRSLHDKLPPERRGKLISIATDNERTLFFDFLPIDLGQVNGFLTRFHLYTVPGQVYYRLSRRAVLQGVDGIVFVADSHPGREHANRDSLADLHDHLRTLGISGSALARVPWVFQYNKRDLPLSLPLEHLRMGLNPHGWPEFEAVASDGRGVSETLRAMCKAVLARLATGTATPTHAPEPAPVAAAGAPGAAPAIVSAVVAPVAAVAVAEPARAAPAWAVPRPSATQDARSR
jgi:signal recognition particle receptor subunit beta